MGRFTPARPLLAVAALVCAGCTQMQEQQDRIRTLNAQVDALSESLVRTEAQLDALQRAVSAEFADNRSNVDELQSAVAQLPQAMQAMCPEPEVTASVCEDVQIQRVPISGDNKIVIGEQETVWIDPPGMSLQAKVDTGAATNSLNAEDMVLFERDGDDWVRFHVRDSATNEMIEIEREVLRYVRVYQQADREGTRRPVVRLRLHLGDVSDRFEFTLADRSHLDHQILLGRSFLTDIALVDVGRQFVQPRYRPEPSQ